jgi:HSP20 family molecular chaperone IbpA
MMKRRDSGAWMWAEAVDLMEQAERMHRQFFRFAGTGATERPRWEPPVDVYSTGEEVLVEIALPGVPADRMELVLAPGELIVRGERRTPRGPGGATIHRLEIPYGRFERRLALPPGSWQLAGQELANGCLQLLLARH